MVIKITRFTLVFIFALFAKLSHASVITHFSPLSFSKLPSSAACQAENNVKSIVNEPAPSIQTTVESNANGAVNESVANHGLTLVMDTERFCLALYKALNATSSNKNQLVDNSVSDINDLNTIEKQNEEERLKVMFVDVNTVVESVGYTMDWTANLLDGFFAQSDKDKNKAKTWGHFVLGWEPRIGEVFSTDTFPVRFKIKAKLPNLENKVELILSDGEDDDYNTLPYESVKTEAFKLSENSLGAAVRFLHAKSENVSTSARLGWGQGQMYTRVSATYRKKYLNDKVIFNVKPAIEYYVVDGWGAKFLLDAGYKIDQGSELRYNLSLRDLESFESSEWRSGLFKIDAVGDKAALIYGMSSFGYLEPKPDVEQHRFSVRYRFNALRRWIFFEIEPFVELRRENPLEEGNSSILLKSFVRDAGISFRFESHYGFL